jgi:thiamine-phosphate diphosphorylase
MHRLFGIYAIVDTSLSLDPECDVEALLRGGVRLVQYRSKRGVEREVVRRLHRLAQREGALLIVNDDADAAEDADGLHVGQEDLARMGAAIQGRQGRGILGVSCGTASEAVEACRLGADYLGVGPFAVTATKDDAGEPIGARGVAAVVAAAGEVPIAAIGGIGLPELDAVVASGAKMAAVISALNLGNSPESSARALIARWNELVHR